MATNSICSITDCGKPTKAKDLCVKHYSRLLRHGDPMKKIKPRGEAIKFLQEVVLPYKGDECLFWPYSKTGREGSGWVSWNGKGSRVSRVVCEEINGHPPTKLHQAAHSCGNGHLACATPNHLRWATPKENSADMISHGTSPRGERQGSSKLVRKDVLEIRSLEGQLSADKIAEMFGVGISQIRRIQKRKHWAWLD